jgi:hypothetical protein
MVLSILYIISIILNYFLLRFVHKYDPVPLWFVVLTFIPFASFINCITLAVYAINILYRMHDGDKIVDKILGKGGRGNE